MAISKRTLMKWRKEALKASCAPVTQSNEFIETTNRILKMTQELLDQELIKEDK